MVTTYRNYVLLYSLKNVVKEVATCVFYLWKEKTIALHPGISKQDVVFHTSTQEKKKKQDKQSCLRDYKVFGIYKWCYD